VNFVNQHRGFIDVPSKQNESADVIFANLALNLLHLLTLRMKKHSPKSRQDKLPHLFFKRQFPQSLINPAFSFDCLGG